VIKLHCKLRFKHKKKRHKVFNTEINNDTVFFLNLKDKKKINNEIAVLFKKTVSKILKFEWVIDSEFFLYIID